MRGFELPKMKRDQMPAYTSVALTPPEALTMDRVSENSDLIVAQSTSQFCRCLCFQPSINWILSEENNFTPGMNPFDLQKTSGWIHEESSFCDRTCSHPMPGCRETTYLQHAGQPPAVLMRSERSGVSSCLTIQSDVLPEGLSEEDRYKDLVAVHHKHRTCGTHVKCHTCYWLVCCNLPYLETRDPKNENTLGSTRYVCDYCLFVPKFDIFDKDGQHRYRIRPDTCCCDCCVRPRFGGRRGRCCRVPFIIRHPDTHLAVATRPPSNLAMDRVIATNNDKVDAKARVDVLWSGWANECCTKRNAYHLAFPDDATVEDKLTLIGSSILLDITMYEQQNDE